jgi:hypothetical protein
MPKMVSDYPLLSLSFMDVMINIHPSLSRSGKIKQQYFRVGVCPQLDLGLIVDGGPV